MKANTDSIENMNMFEYLPSMQSVVLYKYTRKTAANEPSLSLDPRPPPLIELELSANRFNSFS